jgi:TIR domain-containing protein
MTYCPGFAYDVFVSYAAADETADKWLGRLIDDLNRQLTQRLDGFEISFNNFPPNLPSPNVALEVIRQSAIFLPVLSPSYMQSEFALQELGAATLGRIEIVPVEISPVGSSIVGAEWKAFRFWLGQEGKTTRIAPNGGSNSLYHKQMHDLADHMVQRLNEIRSVQVRKPESIELDISFLSDADHSTSGRPYSLKPSAPSVPAAPQSRAAVSNSLDADEVLRRGHDKLRRKLILHARNRDAVEFAISNPAAVKLGTPFVVDAWAFKPSDRPIAKQRALELLSADALFRSGASAAIPQGKKLKFELHASHWSIEPKFQVMVWTGHVGSVSFRVRPDSDVPSGIVSAICKITARGLRLGEIHFDLKLADKQGENEISPAKRLTAFASYASQDRSEVLARVQGIQKFVDVFMDIRNLAAGDLYPSRLLAQIDESDVLYLFWSRHAARSKWVEKEWRYALRERGVEFIDPVPLVDPREVPPPSELAGQMHFNDWTLAFLEYEKSSRKRHR